MMNNESNTPEHPNLQESKNNQPKFLVISVIAVIFAFVSVFIFVKNYAVKMAEYNEKIIQIETLKAENSKLVNENKTLKQQINYLNTTSGIESVAREKLGLIKPSEVAFVVVKDNTKKKKLNHPDNPSTNEKSKVDPHTPETSGENWFTHIWNILLKGK